MRVVCLLGTGWEWCVLGNGWKWCISLQNKIVLAPSYFAICYLFLMKCKEFLLPLGLAYFVSLVPSKTHRTVIVRVGVIWGASACRCHQRQNTGWRYSNTPTECTQYTYVLLFTKCLIHVSAHTAPSSGRYLVTCAETCRRDLVNNNNNNNNNNNKVCILNCICAFIRFIRDTIAVPKIQLL